MTSPPSLPFRRPAALLAISLAWLLASCGGGGGGSSGAGGGSGFGGPTGLVAAAPTPGAVLAADANELRVLRPYAVWTYRGVDQPGGQANASTLYTNVLRHASAAGGTTESVSNFGNEGADSQVVVSSGGVIKTVTTIDFTGTGHPQTFDDIELRSPVRANDYYVIFDKRLDSGIDFDGDGKTDALDVAITRHVVGEELLDLPNRRQVNSVRVDTLIQSRVRFSSNGTFTDVAVAFQLTWYARGLGIVRTRLERPGANVPSIAHISTEDLLTWDGVTEGVGPLPQQAGIVPAGFEAPGAIVPGPSGAVAFAGHAVVLGGPTTTPLNDGFALSAIDFRGNVTASRNYRRADFGATFLEVQRLVRVGNELRVIAFVDGRLDMLAFDTTGQARTAAQAPLVVETLPGFDDSTYVRAAGGTDRFWLIWKNAYEPVLGTILSDLKVQAFDAAGQPLGSPVLLEQGVNGAAVLRVRLSAAPGDPVLASWSLAGEVRYAAIGASSGALLARKTPADTGLSLDGFPIEPAALGTGLTLTAPSPAPGLMAGVRLDASYNPIRGTGSQFISESITPSWWLFQQGAVPPAGAFGRLFMGAYQFTKEFPGDISDTSFLSFVELTPTAGALGSNVELLGRLPFDALEFPIIVPLPDRLLVVGTRNQGLATVPIWRAP